MPALSIRRFGMRALALAGLCAVWTAPAWAPGSLGLDEVLEAVTGAPKLVAEINAELAKAGLKVEDVVCSGARHGNHWKYLGGGRAAPYECMIGKREIEIDADRTYYDERGRALGNVDEVAAKKAFARAKTFRETNFRWTWKQ